MGRPPTAASTTWPLVGRDEALDLVTELMNRRDASGAVVAGAPGVGKTRFAAEVLRQAEESGCVTGWASGTHSAATVPFGAFAHLLPASGRLGPSPIDVLRHASRALLELADGRPFVLVVDDAHLLDAGSAALVQELAITGAARILVTLRPAEAAPDPVVALWKDRLFTYVELQPLARQEVEELISRALGGEVDGGTAQRLWNVSQGNVLFLRELVLDGLDRRVLTRTDGRWRWRGGLAGGHRLSELLAERLGQVGAKQRGLLELVALAEPVGAAVLQRRLPLERIEALERRGLIQATRDGRRVNYRSGHPLYGELLRARVSPLRARAIRRELADTLEAWGARRRGDLLRLATWRLESVTAAKPALFLAAAGHAEAGFDPSLAERLARAAVDAGGGLAAEQALAVALSGQGRFAEAEALLASLAKVAETDAERVPIAQARVVNLHWGLRDSDSAKAVVDEARASVREDDARDELTALAAWLAYYSGRPLDAIEIAAQILGRESVSERLGVRTALAAAPALAMTGKVDDAAALVDQWEEGSSHLAEEMPLAPQELQAGLVLALTLGGHLGEAHTRAEASYRTAVSEGTHAGTSAWTMILGSVAIMRGDLKAAVRWLDESLALLREFDALGSLSWTLALFAQATAQLGDHRAAETALAEADAVRRGGLVLDFDVRLARAWVTAAGGDLSAAQTLALEAADSAAADGEYGFAVIGFHDAARLGDAAAAASGLGTVADLVQGRLAPACAAHATALVERDAPALEHAAEAFAEIGAFLRAAEAAAAASVEYSLQGRTSSARAAGARAQLLSKRCDGARTPALAAAGPVAQLTPRERDIATLASAGLSNHEIADRLVVSVRTVENHLQHAYVKLGVNNRQALRTLLHLP